MEGTIIFYNPQKGFGFIGTEIDGLQEDVFVHRSNMPYPWKHRELQHQPCTFELGEFRGKRTATNVQVSQSAESFYLDAAVPVSPEGEQR